MPKLPPGPYEWMNRDLMDSDGNAIIINASCDPALRYAIAALPELVKAVKEAKRILWMAERYAEGGGSGGPEMSDYREVDGAIHKALEKAGII